MIQPVILCGGSGTRLWPLFTSSGSAAPSTPRQRAAVCCSSVRSPFTACRGLGWYSRDSGQSRVPDPPHRITGWIISLPKK